MKNNTKNQLSHWWSIPEETLFTSFNVDPKKGLNTTQAESQKIKFGNNDLWIQQEVSILKLILKCIMEPMMLLLFIVTILSFIFGKIIETISMLFVIIAYITVELIHTIKTNRIIKRLSTVSIPSTKIMRNSQIILIQRTDIVVGDILIISEGMVVPADARLITAHGLMVDESSLTGESFLVAKQKATIPPNTPVTKRLNSIFSGTKIMGGDGIAIVTAVGKNSNLGIITQKIQYLKKDVTPLQLLMKKFAKTLALCAIIISMIIPFIGYLLQFDLHEMIFVWLSLTFLMIPGQLPIIIILSFAYGSFILAKKKIIVQNLHGIETIGQVTIIVSDKTGTITENKMVVESFFTFETCTKKLAKSVQEHILLAVPDHTTDPTDIAVLNKLNIKEKTLEQIDFHGFSDQQLWRDLVYKKNGMFFHAITGNPEFLISKSKLSLAKKNKINDFINIETQNGKRIIAYASIENKIQKLNQLDNMDFIALALISDPVREGVIQTINILQNAFIKTFIVTGDHQYTTQKVASDIGIHGQIITGDQLDMISDTDLVQQLQSATIFAQMNPFHKLRIVQLLKKMGETVAVFGDGMNDTPALKASHVGIAMGYRGTDLAKEVSDIIFTDDNYTHLPKTIEVGRSVLDNISKGLSYYLSAKSVLIIIFIIPLLLKVPFPFSPLQIIIIELLMDLASTTIFITESAAPNIMKQPTQNIYFFIKKKLIFKVIQNSIPLSAGILWIYLRSYQYYGLIVARTAAFVTWLLGHIFLALNLKQEKEPLWIQGIRSNNFGFFWLCCMICVSFAVTNIPQFHRYVGTTFLPFVVWGELIISAFVTTFWIEIKKLADLKIHYFK